MQRDDDLMISEGSLDSSKRNNSDGDNDSDNYSESDICNKDLPDKLYNLKNLDNVHPHPEDIPDSYRTINQILLDRGSNHNYNCENDVPIHKHREMDVSRQAFKQWMDEKHRDLYHCPWCKERSFTTFKASQKDAEDGECTKCYNSRKKYNGKRKMTIDFDMDPFPSGYSWAILDLKPTIVEEMLVSPVLTIFRAYILPTGAVKYQGNAVCFEQSLFELAEKLPRLVSQLPITIIIRKSNPTFPRGYRDFKVRRKVVEFLLQYVIDNFSSYSEQNKDL